MKKVALSSLFLILAIAFAQAQVWTFYHTGNSPLPFNTVNALQADPQGNMWIGTDYGLARLDPNGNWTVWQTNNSDMPDDAVRSLHLDPDSGGMWVGTFQNGVARFDGNTSWTNYNAANSGLSDNYVRSIAIDSQGVVWFGTAGGLSKFEDPFWTVYHQQNTPIMRSSNISALDVDGSGGLWAGTINGGLTNIANGTFFTYYNGNSPITDNTILDLEHDASGNLWMTTPTGGINILQTSGTWSRLTTMNAGLPTNSYYSLCLRGDQPFLGSQLHGLVWENGQQFVHYDTGNSPLPENSILCLHEGPDGRIWIGTYNAGVAVFAPDSVQTGLPLAADADKPAFWAGGNAQLAFFANELYDYEIHAIDGQKVQAGHLAEGPHLLDATGLPAGVYVFSAVGRRSGKLFSWKFSL